MINIFTSPIFYICLTLGLYSLFSFLRRIIKNQLFNPLILTSISIILYLLVIKSITGHATKETVDIYTNALNFVNFMLSPLTVCLALPIYTRRHIIKQYWLPILVGTVIGCAVSMSSVFILGHFFGLNKEMIYSLLPKSVTTAIAKEISQDIGGIPEITIASVIVTGICGALFGPILTKIFKLERSASIGMAFGASSHAVGTSKAVEISTRAGAISSVAIVTSGILTVIIALFL